MLPCHGIILTSPEHSLLAEWLFLSLCERASAQTQRFFADLQGIEEATRASPTFSIRLPPLTQQPNQLVA